MKVKWLANQLAYEYEAFEMIISHIILFAELFMGEIPSKHINNTHANPFFFPFLTLATSWCNDMMSLIMKMDEGKRKRPCIGNMGTATFSDFACKSLWQFRKCSFYGYKAWSSAGFAQLHRVQGWCVKVHPLRMWLIDLKGRILAIFDLQYGTSNGFTSGASQWFTKRSEKGIIE